jgi:hypothetical protein
MLEFPLSNAASAFCSWHRQEHRRLQPGSHSPQKDCSSYWPLTRHSENEWSRGVVEVCIFQTAGIGLIEVQELLRFFSTKLTLISAKYTLRGNNMRTIHMPEDAVPFPKDVGAFYSHHQQERNAFS